MYGRFLSPDPARDQHFEETQSWNIYSYVRNNPVTHTDPTGMEDLPMGISDTYREQTYQQMGYSQSQAESMVNRENKSRAVIGGTAVAALATGGLATTGTGAAVLGRVGLAVGAGWNKVKDLASSVGSSISNLFSRNSQVPQAIEDKVGQGFNSFGELKNAIGSAGQGNHWHHIVEQSQTGKFGAQAIQNTKNVIAVDAGIYSKISGFYSSKQAFTGGLTVRQWLSSQSFEQQRKFGLEVLKRFGVKAQ